jgi:hypothetical protein
MAEMSSGILSLARMAVTSLVLLTWPQAAAIAAPTHIDHPATDGGFVEPVFDDGVLRLQSLTCCRGSWDGSGPGGFTLGRSLGPRDGRLGRYLRYNSHDNENGGANNGYSDAPIYQQRLRRSRVYQRDSLGGGYYGRR